MCGYIIMTMVAIDTSFSGPIKPMVLAHNDVINKWRQLMGPIKTYV